MKKRLLRPLCLSTIVISLSTYSSSFTIGQNNDVKVNSFQKELITQTEQSTLNKNIENNIGNQIEKNNTLPINKSQSTYKKERKYNYGYTTAKVNIRASPSLDAEIIDTLEFNTRLEYTSYNKKWVIIKYNGQENIAYVYKEYISDNEIESRKYSIPNNSGFKSYMPYNLITSTSSKQYKLQNSYAYTGNYGIRQVNGRYCIAIGTAFNANIGDYGELILENKEIIPIIVSDIKADKDTDCNNIMTLHNGCVSEFLIDKSALSQKIARHGDISFAKDEWNSKVISIKIYNKNVFN